MAESPCGARADDGVQLVDEGDDPAVAGLDLGEDRLQPLLELTPVLRPGHHRAQVQRHEALPAQRLGHIALDDALREPLDDGRLADARLADEHRVVLRPAAQYLHHPPDLVVPADHRVELALTRGRREIGAVLLQRLVRTLGVLTRHALPSPAALERVQQLAAARTVLRQHLPGRTALHRGPDQQVLRRHIRVPELFRSLRRVRDHRQQVTVCLRRRDGRALHAGLRLYEALRALAYGVRLGTDRGQQVEDVLVLRLLQQRQQQVRGGQIRVAASTTALALAALIASRLLLVSSASTSAGTSLSNLPHTP